MHCEKFQIHITITIYNMEQLIHAKQAIKNSHPPSNWQVTVAFISGARQRSFTEGQGLPVKIRSQRQLKASILPGELDARLLVGLHWNGDIFEKMAAYLTISSLSYQISVQLQFEETKRH